MSLAPKRFVSETGVVCVHYEGGTGGVAGNSRRSCFKSPSSAAAGYTPPGPRVVKKVKWQDADAEPETDQQCDKEKKLRRLSVSDYNDLKNNDEPEDTESTESEDEAHTTARQGSPIPPFALLPVKNEEEDEASEPIVGAINDYLSERLLNTNISGPAKRTDVSSDDGEMTELPQNENEPLRKKKKFESFPGVSNIDKGAALRRKVCLKDLNPVGYLQEACQFRKVPLPTYINIQEPEFWRSVCVLENYKTEGKGSNLKLAKKMAASMMIQHHHW